MADEDVDNTTGPADHEVTRSVRVAATRDRVEVLAEARHDVQVTGRARVTTAGSVTTVDEVENRITILVPNKTNVVIGTTSGRVEVHGNLGDVAITTVSGRVNVTGAASLDVRSESSRVDVSGIDQHCRIRTHTGEVRVNDCGGPADLATDSGRIDLKAANGSVTAHCVSGRIVVAMDSANDVAAETVTGRIDVSLPSGVRPYNPEIHGLQDNTPDGFDCTVVARSVDGRVTVEPR